MCTNCCYLLSALTDGHRPEQSAHVHCMWINTGSLRDNGQCQSPLMSHQLTCTNGCYLLSALIDGHRPEAHRMCINTGSLRDSGQRQSPAHKSQLMRMSPAHKSQLMRINCCCLLYALIDGHRPMQITCVLTDVHSLRDQQMCTH